MAAHYQIHITGVDRTDCRHVSDCRRGPMADLEEQTAEVMQNCRIVMDDENIHGPPRINKITRVVFRINQIWPSPPEFSILETNAYGANLYYRYRCIGACPRVRAFYFCQTGRDES